MKEVPDWQGDPIDRMCPPQAEPADPADVRWYLPSVLDVLRLAGWWNLAWLPAIAVAAASVAGLFPVALLACAPIGVIVIALPIFAFVNVATLALRWRRDPFCIHCGYSLLGRADGTPCPECGSATSEKLCRAYQYDPYWFIERWNHEQGRGGDRR